MQTDTHTLIRHHEKEAQEWQDLIDSLGHIQSDEQWRLFNKYSSNKNDHTKRIAELRKKLNK